MAFELRLPAVALAVLLLPGLAWAEPSAADRETARTYMAEGRAKRDGNDLRAALRAFEAADAIMHVPTTGLEVARTQAMLGALVEARDYALRVARSTPRPGEPSPFTEARSAAQKLADDLEARIPSIRVVVKGPPPGLEVWIDKSRVPDIAIGLPRKLDPGNHVIVAKAGATARTLYVQVLEHEAKEVPIDLAAPEPPPVDTGAPSPEKPATPSPPPHRGPWLTVGIVTLTAGGAALVLGTIAGAVSIAQTSNIQSSCNVNVCPPVLPDGTSTDSAISKAKTFAAVSDVGFIAGGVLAAAGVAFVVVGSSHGSKSSMALSAGPGSVMLSGTF